MSVVAAIKTSITADTTQFDIAMKRVQAQAAAAGKMARPAMGAIGGFGAIGGGLGRIGGAALAGGPAAAGLVVAITALTQGLQSMREEMARSSQSLQEMHELSIGPEEEGGLRRGAQALFGEKGTAAQMLEAQRRFQNMTGENRDRMRARGVSAGDLADLQSSDLKTFLDALHRVSQSLDRDSRRELGEMLGGTAGAALMRAAMVRTPGRATLGRLAEGGSGDHYGIARAQANEDQRIADLFFKAGDSIWTQFFDLLRGQLLSNREQIGILRAIEARATGGIV